MPNQPEPLADLAERITADINEAMAKGADRRDAITALHMVLARITRETEEMTRRPPDIRASEADNRLT